ncbi:MAG: malectin domain-containing carbohydrate-binding protein, partial [Pseudomonadota bacterium]
EGGIDATGVQVEDLLANGYTFVSAEGDGTYDDLTGIWDIGTILSGQSASIEITASINESTVGDAVVYRVNPGGTTQAAADSSSLDWLGDTAAANLNGNPPSTASYATGITLTGGQKFGNENNSPTFDLSLLPLGTAASAVLFETERFGVPPSAAAPQEWDFEVENGTYTVNLYFAEIFANAPGARVFDIEVEGNVLEDYDIFVAAGNAQNKAILESFTDVMVNDGNLDIDFTTVIDNAKISAIEIIQQDVPSDYSNYAQILTADQSDPDSTAGDDSNGDDDDASITLTPIQPINDVSIIANMDAEEPGTNGEFIVSLENIASTNTTVTYSIMGTAENGVDYELLSGEVIIAQGDLEASIPVTIIDDLEVEGVESVMIELTGASGDADIGLGDTTSATVMITDDDVANEINIVATADAAEPATNGQFKISLDNAASTDTEIALTVEVTSTATADIDYTALPASVMIMQGETEAILDLTILDDIDIEGTETVQVTLDNIVSGDANLMIGAMNSATVNILDDDFNYGASVSVSGTTTFGTSSFTLTNNSDPDVIIKSVQFDILTSTLSLGLDSSGAPGTEFLGAVWDPTAEAGDEGGQAIKFANNDAGLVDEDGMVLTPITADNGYQGELENYPFTGQLVGGNGAAGGFGLMTLNFDNFDATENFIFGIDVDPQSIQNATGTGQAGAVSGGEIAGTTVTITFENASGVQQVVTQQLELTGLNTSEAIFTSDPVIPAPIMNVVGLTETERRVETSIAQQTVEVTGVEAGAIVELYFVDASGYLKTGGDGTETIPNDPFHANQIDAAPSILSAVANELGVATFMIDLSNGVAGAAPALVDDLFFLSAGVVNEEGVLISQLSEAAEIALVENASPIAIDDEFENVENAIILGNVLIDNGAGADSDPEEDPISVVSGEFMTTEGGSFTVNEFGDFIYIPLADFTGTDTVEYTLEDSLGGSDIGTVTFTVSEDDPIANDDAFSTKPSGIAVFNVLNNDTDIDGIPLTDGDLISPTVLTSNSGNATVLDLGDGRVIYIANDDALPGIDTFSYTINTASGSDSADVSVFVTDPGNLPEGSIVNGNSNDEDLIGVAENNTLFGDDGNDILYSLNGNDTLNGGDGSDILIAEGGSNLLTGGNDADLFVLTHEPQAGNDFEVITDIDTVEDDMILLAIEGLTNPDGSIAADRVSLFSAGSDSFLLADIDNDLANGNEAALARLDDLDSTTDPDALLASILANDLITV